MRRKGGARSFGRGASACVIALAGGVAAGVGGCVTEGPPARPKPRAIPAQPEGIMPEHMVLLAEPPEDTDADGYFDTLRVVVSLFDEEYPFALRLPGTFVFTLRDADGRVLSEWRFDRSDAERALAASQAGPSYRFTLSARDAEDGQRDAPSAGLTGQFTPEGGTPVRAQRELGFRWGRVSR